MGVSAADLSQAAQPKGISMQATLSVASRVIHALLARSIYMYTTAEYSVFNL